MVFLIILVLLLIVSLELKKTETSAAKSDKEIAIITCSKPGAGEFIYRNIRNCWIAYNNFTNNSFCLQGCLGLFSCIGACPTDAINKRLEVDRKKCNGCWNCVQVCPMDLIKVRSYNAHAIFIGCKTTLNIEQVKKSCENGCIKCYLCLEVCNLRAFYVDERGLPKIDYSKCNGCDLCIRKCPTGVLKRIEQHI